MISGRTGEVESLGISFSHLFQYLCWNRLCVESVSSRGNVVCDAALRRMARKIFSPFWQLVGSRLLLRFSSISLRYRSQFAFFKLMLEQGCIGLIVTSICKLMRIGRWSEPWFVCKLVEVIRGADANDTSDEIGLALLGNLVGESPSSTCYLSPLYNLSVQTFHKSCRCVLPNHCVINKKRG